MILARQLSRIDIHATWLTFEKSVALGGNLLQGGLEVETVSPALGLEAAGLQPKTASCHGQL
jgi:hypothetical protein